MNRAIATVILLICFASTAMAQCAGTRINGPWFSFLLPEGMQLEASVSGEITRDSVWIERGDGTGRVMFFVFAPQHGGKPYRAYLGSEAITPLIEAPNDLGTTHTFIVHYSDGSTGLFQGTSQRITGLRTYGQPLGAEGLQDYECFLESIEGYAD